MPIASPSDFRDQARKRLPKFLFDYLDGGANEEATLSRNCSDLAGIEFRQRVMRGTATADLRTELFGQALDLPIALAPVGLTGMYARRGEVQAGIAAKRKNIPYCLSTVSVCSLEEVRAGADPNLWFQLYMLRDRGFMQELLARAAAQRCSALLFTVDMPLPGLRYRDGRSGMLGRRAAWRRCAQAVAHPAWAWDVGVRGRPLELGNIAPALRGRAGLDDYFGWIGANFDASIAWSDLDWIRERWSGPLVIKGVLDAEDARAAAAIGADGIVVSNHGGRQLDGVPSSVKALPAIADAVGGDLSILADSGIRSGLDVMRMLALGARGVLLGRSALYALAAGGAGAIEQLLGMYEQEMRVAMALTGVSTIAAIDRTILAGSAPRA